MELFIKEIWHYPKEGCVGAQVREIFVDGKESVFKETYPLRLISEKSLQDLNERLGKGGPVPMNWFRPHLVLSGLSKAFEEDYLDVLSAEGFCLHGGMYSALPTCKTVDSSVLRIDRNVRLALTHRQWKYRGDFGPWFGRSYTVKGTGRIYEGMRLQKVE